MNLLLHGPVEGHIHELQEHTKHLGTNVHWIVCAGDFGIWPDPARMDRAARKHAEPQFAKRYVGTDPRPIEVPTLTIAGVHDDNRWLAHRLSIGNMEVLNNVHWLANGYRTEIGWDMPLRVTGFGRAYSDATYSGRFGKRSHRHYTRRDVERACSAGPTDLLVVYEHLDAPGIRNVIYATRPKLILNVQHPNRKLYSEIQGIEVVQLGRFQSKLLKYDGKSFIH